MRAVVLVGGEGTRLRPLTSTTPKQMLPVVEQPMIERVVDHLARHGIDDVVLSLGYRPDAFIDAYPGGTIGKVSLGYAVEPAPLDTAGAIRFAARHARIDDTFVAVNGDVLTDMNLSDLAAFHRRMGAQATISLTPVDDPSAFGVVPTDERGRVVAFIEKPSRGEAPTNYINAGAYVLEPAVIDRIADGRRVSIERETFPTLVDSGVLFALPSSAYWLDTGTPDAYLRAHRDLLVGARPGPPAPGAELDPSIGPGVFRIGEVEADSTATVSGSLLGRGAAVSGDSMVDESVLGSGSVVEDGASVIGSVLLPGARVARKASVEGSIVGPGAIVGRRCEIRPLSIVGAGAVTEAGSVIDGARIAPDA